jgi:hypothetical protein
MFEKLFGVWLAWTYVRFILSKNSNEASNAALHSPSHLVGASGAIQIVINMHVIFDWG